MTKRVGRPPVNRVALSLRVSPEIRKRLEVLSSKSGRSISQEAELRIEQSFDREATVREVMRQIEERRC